MEGGGDSVIGGRGNVGEAGGEGNVEGSVGGEGRGREK
jgi:hypothetical protein